MRRNGFGVDFAVLFAIELANNGTEECECNDYEVVD